MPASTAAPTVDSIPELDTRAAALLDRLDHLRGTRVTAETLPDWLGTWSRIKCEQQTLWMERILATKRDSNDAQAQALYGHLMGTWMPRLETYDAPLTHAALAAGVAEFRPGLARKLRAELGGEHTEGLGELLANERLLSRQYDAISSNQRVDLAGTSLTAREAQDRLASETAPDQREVLWKAVKQSDLVTASELDTLFSQLLRVRQQVAVRAGSVNYAEYVWRQTNREYTIQDAVEFLDGVAEVFTDLTAQVDRDRAAQLGKEQLHPWDLSVHLEPSASDQPRAEEYAATAEHILGNLDPAFGAVVRQMEAEGRLDLRPRPGKSRGNVAGHLFAYGTSEILCNVTGGLKEFRTVLHELGHAVHTHSLSSNPDNLVWDFYDFQEVCEFCAFVFTSLGTFRLFEEFGLSQDERRWQKRSLASSFLTRLRDVDERVRVELWLYQQMHEVTIEEVDAFYLSLYRRPAVDWSGHEDRLRKGWQSQFLFLYSFYNIEYSIATIAALLFVKAHEDDPAGALARLKLAMRTGATAGPKAIFAEAGISFPFSNDQLITARDVLAEWLNQEESC